MAPILIIVLLRSSFFPLYFEGQELTKAMKAILPCMHISYPHISYSDRAVPKLWFAYLM